MKSVGVFLKSARIRKRYQIVEVAEKTKIRQEFIRAIEREDWESLSDFSVVAGFVRSIAAVLDLNEEQAAALLRRDYPVKRAISIPKPDLGKKFVWNPKLTFLIGVGVVLIVILTYLVFQYQKFVSPPLLTVDVPTEGQTLEVGEVEVRGKTDVDATVKVNNQPAIVDDAGNFRTEIEVSANTSEIEVRARSRSGKETTMNRKIEVK